MALEQNTPETLNDRIDNLEAAVRGDALICLDFNNDVYISVGDGAPVDGSTGTGVDVCGTGSLYVDRTTPGMYVNAGTRALPYWYAFGHTGS